MSEPPEWHPTSRLLYEYCAAKPDAVEDHPWGDTVFKIRGKLFAIPSVGSPRITLKPRKEDLDGLLQLPFIQRAAYVGRYGWVTVTVEDDDALDLARDLIDASYDQIAGKKRR
jgi:predicted DNA-binding protein (MmcQ/YjbR family)